MSELDKYDQAALDDMIKRIGVIPILESLADHVLFYSVKSRRYRDNALNQEAKARHRLNGRKLESISNDLIKLSWKMKHIPL